MKTLTERLTNVANAAKCGDGTDSPLCLLLRETVVELTLLHGQVKAAEMSQRETVKAFDRAYVDEVERRRKAEAKLLFAEDWPLPSRSLRPRRLATSP